MGQKYHPVESQANEFKFGLDCPDAGKEETASDERRDAAEEQTVWAFFYWCHERRNQ